MRKLFIIAISFLFSVSMFAQTTIEGNVKDAKSGEPLPGVNIKVAGKSLGTTTDFDGNYTLKVNQEPPFDVVITTLGYAKKTISVTKNNQKVDVSLDENASDLDEVVVSASRTPESVRESPVTIERMDARTIKNSTSASFYNSIENLKGVDINKSSLTFNSVNTRGFATYANTRFVQLVDGMDNASPALNFVMGNLVGINELDVNSVELMPGASSALYGANAFNGILFMTSKNPFDHQGVSFYAKKGVTSSEALGTNPYHDFGIRAAHAFSEKFAAKASFSYLEGTDWAGTDTNNYREVGGGEPDIITKIGTSPLHDGVNIYGDEITLRKIEKAGGVDFSAMFGLDDTVLGDVSRTGYLERDLTGYDAKSMKFDGSLNFRPNADDLEIVANYRIGIGNTLYQGTDRYNLDGFTMSQFRLEVKNDDFFLRGYRTSEDAGNSYDMNFAGINMSKINAGTWFGTYAGVFAQNYALNGNNAEAAHAAARIYADENVSLKPGTPEFQSALNAIIQDPDVTSGAKFEDNTSMTVAEGNYNFKSLLKVMDLQVGGSYRSYDLNSGGTIFTDKDAHIKYNEIGAYVQGIKKFMDDRLKVTASIRFDKSENFDANLSPRVSFNYAAGDNKKHNFRASYQTGFRNPTTQDLYIGLNAGPIILIGGAPGNLDKDLPSTSLTARDGYENAYSLVSAQEFGATVRAAIPTILAANPGMTLPTAQGIAIFQNQGILKAVKTDLVAPEKVTAFDIGYRGKLGTISVDFNAFMNKYEGFISNTRVVSPNDRSNVFDVPTAGVPVPLAVQNVAGGNIQAFQLYTNSDADVSSYGATVGLSTRVADNYRFGLSYTYSKLDFDQKSNPDFRTYFNTPEHKVKFSVGNPKLYKNLGFNLNVRWNDGYLWEATAASGMLDSKTLVDAMLSYKVAKLKSSFKIGGSNLGGTEYRSSIGGGYIGKQYFVSWTINN